MTQWQRYKSAELCKIIQDTACFKLMGPSELININASLMSSYFNFI